jgi:hypothetical protein
MDYNSGRPDPKVPQGQAPKTANGFHGNSGQHSTVIPAKRQDGRSIKNNDRPNITAGNASRRASEKR